VGSYILGHVCITCFFSFGHFGFTLGLTSDPPKELAISSWLSIGPIGTGALAMLLLGQAAPQVLQQHNLQLLGPFCSIAVYSLLWCLWESVFGG
jgi:hypothetical protein